METWHQQDRRTTAAGRGGPPRPHETRRDGASDRRLTRRAGDDAIARNGSAEACLAALKNPATALAPSAMTRIAGRLGHVSAVREALLARPDLPLVLRVSLVRQLSGVLAGLAASRGWLARGRAEQAAREASEKAAVAIATLHPDQDIRPLIRHLYASGELTVELTLRALLSGHLAMFEWALAERAGLPLRRVRALVRNGSGFRTALERAGLPASACVVLRETLMAVGEMQSGVQSGMRQSKECAGGRLERRLVACALVACASSGIGESDPLTALLRRFAVEAADENPAANGAHDPPKQILTEDAV